MDVPCFLARRRVRVKGLCVMRSRSSFSILAAITGSILFMTSAVWAGPSHADLDAEVLEMGVDWNSIPRREVSYQTDEAPGTVIVDTGERRLYLILEDGYAMRYGIGVAREGFEWNAVLKISAKRVWPDWTPPEAMLQRRPDLPRHMVGGLDNPLGARALYLGNTLYRIHGSNEPETIGEAVSSGCIRMLNADVIDLYERVKVGAKVIIQ